MEAEGWIQLWIQNLTVGLQLLVEGVAVPEWIETLKQELLNRDTYLHRDTAHTQRRKLAHTDVQHFPCCCIMGRAQLGSEITR